MKSNITKIKNDFVEFYDNVVSKKLYTIPVFLFSIAAYGFDMFNRSVSMDDMAFSIFGKEGMWGISLMRWGLYIFAPLFSTKEYSPFIGRFISFILLIVSSILLSFIMYVLKEKKKNVLSYTVLSVIFVTFPLINEMWEFSSMNVNLSYNAIPLYLCLSFGAIIYQMYCDNHLLNRIIISSLLLTPVTAGYESVLFVYITLVLIVLYNNNLNKKAHYNWFLDGLLYAIPLIISFILKVAVGNLLIIIYNVPNRTALNRSFWSTDIKTNITQILYNGWYYLIRSLSYFPIAEFDIALIIFVIYIIKDSQKSKLSLLLGLFIVLSLFFLSIIQGNYLYYRTAQTIQLFVAYVLYLVVDNAYLKSEIKKDITIIFCIFVCLRQSIYLHDLLALNNQRSDNEAYIARTIGYRIYSEFDKDKTVIFCGEYQLGSFIEDQITIKDDSLAGKVEALVRDLVGHDEGREYQEFVSTNINSYFNKQMDAFNGQIMLKKYLSYYGFDINVLENLTDKEEDKLKGYYEKIAQKENMKPFDIKDMGDYLLVYLGPTIDGYGKLKY